MKTPLIFIMFEEYFNFNRGLPHNLLLEKKKDIFFC